MHSLGCNARQSRSCAGASDAGRGPDRTPDLEPPQQPSLFSALLYGALLSVLVGSCLVVGFYQLEAHAHQPYRAE
ncbi:hypothetical protein MRX96_027497 [Rhipicephalus microplus]